MKRVLSLVRAIPERPRKADDDIEASLEDAYRKRLKVAAAPGAGGFSSGEGPSSAHSFATSGGSNDHLGRATGKGYGVPCDAPPAVGRVRSASASTLKRSTQTLEQLEQLQLVEGGYATDPLSSGRDLAEQACSPDEDAADSQGAWGWFAL